MENEKKNQEIRDKKKANKGKAGKAVQVPGEVQADDLAEGEVFEVIENGT